MNYSKNKFYISYIYYKLRIPLDVYEGRKNILVAELIWLINNIFKKKHEIPKVFKKNYFITKFGKFYITPDVISMITVSPAFERLDTDRLENMIAKELSNKKRVLVIDIGAYFGDYCIRIGNKFSRNKNLQIIAFEPGTEYLSSSTLEQLKKNIKVNNLKNVKIYSFGIGSKSGKNKIGILTKPLDSVLKSEYNKYDSVFIKLDIDDFVIDGLMGIQKSVDKFKNVTLLVEDFVKQKETVNYLKKNNYDLTVKLTPYNSFWIKKNA